MRTRWRPSQRARALAFVAPINTGVMLMRRGVCRATDRPPRPVSGIRGPLAERRLAAQRHYKFVLDRRGGCHLAAAGKSSRDNHRAFQWRGRSTIGLWLPLRAVREPRVSALLIDQFVGLLRSLLAMVTTENSWTMPVLVRPAFQADPPDGAACCECDGKWFWIEANAPTFRRCCTCIPALAREVRLVCTNDYPIPALTGTHDQVRQAERLRSATSRRCSIWTAITRQPTLLGVPSPSCCTSLCANSRQHGGSDTRQGDKPATCWRSWQGGWLRMAGWMPRCWGWWSRRCMVGYRVISGRTDLTLRL